MEEVAENIKAGPYTTQWSIPLNRYLFNNWNLPFKNTSSCPIKNSFDGFSYFIA